MQNIPIDSFVAPEDSKAKFLEEAQDRRFLENHARIH